MKKSFPKSSKKPPASPKAKAPAGKRAGSSKTPKATKSGKTAKPEGVVSSLAASSSHWLMKTEPGVCSFADILKAPGRTTSWEGVRNFQARNFMRDQMRVGQKAFIYHSGVEEPAIMGIATIAREAYADPHQWNPKSEYYDETSPKEGAPRWVMVDVKAEEAFSHPVTLAQLKGDPTLKDMLVIKRGMRLSVQPVSDKDWEYICRLGRSR